MTNKFIKKEKKHTIYIYIYIKRKIYQEVKDTRKRKGLGILENESNLIKWCIIVIFSL